MFPASTAMALFPVCEPILIYFCMYEFICIRKYLPASLMNNFCFRFLRIVIDPLSKIVFFLFLIGECRKFKYDCLI